MSEKISDVNVVRTTSLNILTPFLQKMSNFQRFWRSLVLVDDISYGRYASSSNIIGWLTMSCQELNLRFKSFKNMENPLHPSWLITFLEKSDKHFRSRPWRTSKSTVYQRKNSGQKIDNGTRTSNPPTGSTTTERKNEKNFRTWTSDLQVPTLDIVVVWYFNWLSPFCLYVPKIVVGWYIVCLSIPKNIPTHDIVVGW